jgi:hypothetical protein
VLRDFVADIPQNADHASNPPPTSTTLKLLDIQGVLFIMGQIVGQSRTSNYLVW